MSNQYDELSKDVNSFQKFNDKEALGRILKQYDPMVKATALGFSSSNIPVKILELEAKSIMANSLKNFDEDKGNLSGFFKVNLKRMNRSVNEANPLFIPESRVFKYTKYKTLKDKRTNELGRTPTHEEMGEIMQMNVPDIKRLDQETNRSIASLPDDSNILTASIKGSSENLLDIVYRNTSSPKEKLIIEHTYGMNGNPKSSSNRELAEIIGVSQTSIRSLKDNIASRIREYDYE